MAPHKFNFSVIGPRQKRRRVQAYVELNSKKYHDQDCDSGDKTDDSLLTVKAGSDTDNSNVLHSNNALVYAPLLTYSSPDVDEMPSEIEYMDDTPYEISSESEDQCISPPENLNNNLCSSTCSDRIKNHLKLWIESEKVVPRSSVDRLLKRLSENFILPTSVKTLLKSEKCDSISVMGEGEYIHFNNWVKNVSEFICSASHDISTFRF